MQYVLIIHEVENYTEWKEGFDRASKIRKEAGELAYQILSFEQEPNKVIHYSRWKSHKEAKAFFESDVVLKIRNDLGVKQPSFNYINLLEEGTL